MTKFRRQLLVPTVIALCGCAFFVAPVLAQDTGNSDTVISSGISAEGDPSNFVDQSSVSGGSDSEYASILADTNARSPVNNSLTVQNGVGNSAASFAFGSRNSTVKVQNGNNNSANSFVIGNDNAVLQGQSGDNHSSNVLIAGATDAGVTTLQAGEGKQSNVYVLGNQGVLVGNVLIRNKTGRAIKNVVVIQPN